MNIFFTVYFIIILAIVAANTPFISNKRFLIFATVGQKTKPFWFKMLEWAVYGLLVLLLARWFEANQNLENYSQSGQYYWALVIVYLTFAFPGFVYQYLWLKPSINTPDTIDELD